MWVCSNGKRVSKHTKQKMDQSVITYAKHVVTENYNIEPTQSVTTCH